MDAEASSFVEVKRTVAGVPSGANFYAAPIQGGQKSV
jgi:hypothetical protein